MTPNALANELEQSSADDPQLVQTLLANLPAIIAALRSRQAPRGEIARCPDGLACPRDYERQRKEQEEFNRALRSRSGRT